MKKIKLFSAVVLLATFFSCTSKKENSSDNSMKTDDGNLKIELSKFATTTDLVCGMDLKDGIGDTMTYKGKLYGFCSTDDKNTFKATPEKFVK